MKAIDLSRDCAGKRHYPTKARALRGVKALFRDARNKGTETDPRGHLSAYRCECGAWCIGRGYEGRPENKRQARMSYEQFGRGAILFARAGAIAKERFPEGANATQLAQVLREVLNAEKVA